MVVDIEHESDAAILASLMKKREALEREANPSDSKASGEQGKNQEPPGIKPKEEAM